MESGIDYDRTKELERQRAEDVKYESNELQKIKEQDRLGIGWNRKQRRKENSLKRRK